MNGQSNSLKGFKDQYAAMVNNICGSGWGWLIIDSNDELSIVPTPNRDNPLMAFSGEKGYPLFGIDFWEHAYYLSYQNRRDAYLKAFCFPPYILQQPPLFGSFIINW